MFRRDLQTHRIQQCKGRRQFCSETHMLAVFRYPRKKKRIIKLRPGGGDDQVTLAQFMQLFLVDT